MIELWIQPFKPEPRVREPLVHSPMRAFSAGARGEPATLNPHPEHTQAFNDWARDHLQGRLYRRYRFIW